MSINDTILTRKAIHCDLLISFHIVNKVSIFYPGRVKFNFFTCSWYSNIIETKRILNIEAKTIYSIIIYPNSSFPHNCYNSVYLYRKYPNIAFLKLTI